MDDSDFTNTGRITVTTNKAPSDGNFHVLLDTSVFDGNVNLNELVLHVDLTGLHGVTFDCLIKSFRDSSGYLSVR